MSPRIYLAGPEVFLPDALEVAAAKKELCSKYGFEGVFPLDNQVKGTFTSRRAMGLKISDLNEELICSCELVIANATPFRGPSCDVGTAYEMGFARAKGLVVYAYSNAEFDFLERTVLSLKLDSTAKQFRDSHDMVVEDFQLPDNLMLPGGVLQSGGIWASTPKNQVKDLYRSLGGFEECLRQARSKFYAQA